MPPRGRPRLTPESLRQRIADYCSRHEIGVATGGLPPFPAGARETPQHREWIALYKAQRRLAKRERGECERCSQPAADNSIFCEAHKAASHAGASVGAQARQTRLKSQRGRCAVCRATLDIADASADLDASGRLRGVLHRRCLELARLAEAAGQDAVGRLSAYLWPAR
jgi:hypothetical protein